MFDFMTPEITSSLMSISAIVATGIVGWVARRLDARFGYEMDARARETLHSALTTGAQMAFARLDGSTVAPRSSDLIDIVVRHVMGDGAGDAVHRLGASHQVVQDLAEAKLAEVGVKLSGKMLGGTR